MIYAAFRERCKSKKLRVMSKKKFGTVMMERHHKQHTSVKHEGKTYWVWLGVKLPQEYLGKPLVREARAKLYCEGTEENALNEVD